MSTLKLFQPTRVGNTELSHRVVFAPTTRFRADTNHVPLPHVAEYYEQRASTAGTLLITEAAYIAPCAGGYTNAPGIWSDEQISAWKAITERVHAKGSFIYLQLWAMGRAAQFDVLAEEGLPYVSASNVPLKGGAGSDLPRKDGPPPRPLTIEEMQEYVHLFATAASNAVHKAGFDGVELHGANGYLLDQFLNDCTNIRTDSYGGSIENRIRFPLEVVDAVVNAVGQNKTAYRISPWGTYNGMRFDNPKPTFAHLVTQLRERYPELAYLHVVEPRVDGIETLDVIKEDFSNDFIRDIWGDCRLISAGGYTRETAIAVAEEKGDLIAFSRRYIAKSGPALPSLARYRPCHREPRALLRAW
ncbi:NADH:flavin oxidoreductase/NADH oxidase [Mycena latifolia]|nr:NADH:flavin oxidoreductase/NADH oxidase [Mycena latifolia]